MSNKSGSSGVPYSSLVFCLGLSTVGKPHMETQTLIPYDCHIDFHVSFGRVGFRLWTVAIRLQVLAQVEDSGLNLLQTMGWVEGLGYRVQGLNLFQH